MIEAVGIATLSPLDNQTKLSDNMASMAKRTQKPGVTVEPGDRKLAARLLSILTKNPDHERLRETVDATLVFWETMAAMDNRNHSAVALGRLGGLAKPTKPRGPAALTPERRAEIARKAAAARWGAPQK